MSSNFISLTPWAERPVWRISFMAQRKNIPFWVITISSSLSPTLFKATASPFLSVTFIFTTPLPPRLVKRYSFTGVRLAKPNSVTVNTVASFSATIMAITSSFLPSLTPRTPFAPLPISLTFSSGNLTALPLRVPINNSCFPSVISTPISSSFFSKVIPMMPPLRGLL